MLGITYKVHHPENIPDKPCVVLSKHQSALDIFVLLKVFDPQTWVFKRELLNIPCFGWALAATRPIAIDRNAGRQALKILIEKGKDKLNKGFWVLLYVPVAINTGLFWQKKKGVINIGVVDIVVGKPITTADKHIKVITAEVESWIEENSRAIALNHPYYQAMKSEFINED